MQFKIRKKFLVSNPNKSEKILMRKVNKKIFKHSRYQLN